MSSNIYRKQKLLFATIILIAAFFRFYGLNWDQNQHLHPDERFLTMVANAISWPRSISEYLDAQQSTLNPSNTGYNFFVYGTFPLFLAKAFATISGLEDYNNFTLLGRALSTLIDLGTVVLVFLIAKALNTKYKIQNIGDFHYLSAFFYAISVLPIQLSHFFAVDTFLTFFITLSFYLLIKMLNSTTNYNKLSRFTIYDLRFTILLGIVYGLALASKISALLFFPIIILGIPLQTLSLTSRSNLDKIKFLLFTLCSFLFFSYLAFRLANPYSFASSNLLDLTPNPQFIQNVKTLKSFNNPAANFPPSIQWIKAKPIIFPLRNMIYYGLGLPLSSLAIGGFIYVLVCLATHFKPQVIQQVIKLVVKKRKTQNKEYKRQAIAYQLYPLLQNMIPFLLIVLWTGGFFFFQSTQFIKAMRYFAPIYPFLAIFAGLFATRIFNFRMNPPVPRSLLFAICYLLFVLCSLFFVLLWPLAFISIYSRPHSRVTASRWIYENIPAGSTLTCEHWDDCLPLPVIKSDAFKEFESVALTPSKFKLLTLPLYDQDTPEKLAKINDALARADYIILSSNRLYGSITSVPERYPQSSKFYQDLFQGKMGFSKVAELTSRPNLSIPFLNLCLTPPFEWYGKIAAKSVALNTKKASLLYQCNASGLTIIDDYADESFTVYDHPKAMIFKRNSAQSYSP